MDLNKSLTNLVKQEPNPRDITIRQPPISGFTVEGFITWWYRPGFSARRRRSPNLKPRGPFQPRLGTCPTGDMSLPHNLHDSEGKLGRMLRLIESETFFTPCVLPHRYPVKASRPDKSRCGYYTYARRHAGFRARKRQIIVHGISHIWSRRGRLNRGALGKMNAPGSLWRAGKCERIC